MNIIGDPIIAANTGSDEIVIISDSQPTEEDNKLWVKNTLTGEGVEIPTMSDVEYMADVRTIAPVEATTTASRAYQKGDFFVLSDKLYKAKTAIASGGTIVIGTNCEEVQVGSELKNLNNVTESIDDLEESVDELSNTLSLLDDEIPDTVQTITFDQNGNVQSITHSRNNVAVRTDVFTFAANSVTEVRTLSTGQSLTIVTNLSTLETTITYSEGGN